MIEHIKNAEQLIAIIIYHTYSQQGITFVTPNDLSQQVAYMEHPAGKQIQAHVHNLVERNVQQTLEVLMIKKGKLRVDFYDSHQRYLESRILTGGDVILLSNGGHGFEVIEDLEMIEVKQGPYLGDKDKSTFRGINSDQIKIEKPVPKL